MNDSIPSNVSHLNRDPSRDPLTGPSAGFHQAAANQSRERLGRSPVSRTSFSRPDSRPPQQQGFVAKGHDRQLQEAQQSGASVRLTLIDQEYPVSGVIVRRDKYTITLRLTEGQEAGNEEFFYKHGISSVLVRRQQQVAQASE